MKKILVSMGLLILAISLYSTSMVSAAVTGFMPGRIIDDSIMTDKSSMSPGEIQSFLNSKVTTCDTWGTQPYGGTTRAQYAASRGYSTPFTCLKDYVENGKTSAQIIYDVSQKYSINPQVMIVLLQKEQGLVTDDWPWSIQYRSATGYGCPDTAPCDAQYYGLTNQLDWAAKMFRAILNNSPTWYTPYVLGDNYIQYSPDANCGGSVVTIQNRSTQALYNYTPYQPNAGALAAEWGTAPCGAYGNRNFYLYFNSWFGSTLAPAYSWSLERQYVYTDSTKTTPTSLNGLAPGQRVYVGLTARNNGSTTWKNTGPNPVRLGTSQPNERWSQLYDSTWLSLTRPTSLKEAEVLPGNVGTFEFWITAPTKSSDTSLKEYFNILAEGRAWMPDIGLFYSGTVNTAKYTWSMASQYAYTDQTKTTVANMNNLFPGQRIYVGFTAKNTGNMIWQNSGPNAVLSGTESPKERSSLFSAGSSWLTGTKPGLLKEASVAPGQNGTFEHWLTVPNNGVYGVYHERFNILANGVTWMNDTGLSYYMNIQRPVYSWSMASQYAYTDDTKTTVANMNSLAPGQRIYVGFTAKNTGNMTWQNTGPNAIMAGTESPKERSSLFSAGSNWLTGTKPTLLKESTVAAGQTGTFEYWLTVPANGASGVYHERFNILANGVAWMNDTGLSYYINVQR